MNILLVSEDIPARQLGGLGKHVVRLGNALIESGHSVTLMGRSDLNYLDCVGEVGFHGPFVGGFDWKRLGWKETHFGVFLPFKRPHIAKRIARAIRARAGEFDVVHYHGHNALVGRYIPKALNFIQTLHDQGSECVIRVRFRQGGVCRESNPKACAACATTAPNLLQREISGMAVRQYRRLAAQALSMHQTIFVSDFLRERSQVTLQALDGRSQIIIHNFCDDQALHPSAEAGAGASSTKSVAIVARIDETKGVGAFLDAVRRRSATGLDVTVVGDGPLLERLMESFSSPTVRFLGWCRKEKAMEIMAGADAVVVPSIWEEPCGTTLLEGLALGKPVFALALGGTPELKRYERWQGQLALYDSMEELVDALSTATLDIPESVRDFSATAQAALPRLTAAYRLYLS